MHLTTLLKGAGIGAAVMYLYDPQRGRRRRKLLRDQYDRSVHRIEDFLSKAQRDISNRASGAVHEVAAMLHSDDADDRVTVERVRSKLGRFVSHPHAIHVEAHDGQVVLSGTIPAEEAHDLLKAVRGVRGVKHVVSRLDPRPQHGDHFSLQGGTIRSHSSCGVTQQNWSPATRVLAQLAGMALIGNCLVRRNLSSTLLGTAGFALFVRGTANRGLGELVGAPSGPQATGFQRTVTIGAPVEIVWDFITDFEQMRRFLPSVKSVQELGGGRYRWTLDLPAGRELHFEERITESVAHERLSWESVSDQPVSYAGTVQLQPEERNVTRAHIRFDYTPPGGALADWLASLFGMDAESKFQEAVLRIKTFLETGRSPDAQEVNA